jgi:hypothetical protein
VSRPASPAQSCAVSTESQIRFRQRLVKAASFFGSERLPSTNAPLREPATVLTASPPRGGFQSPFTPRAPRGFPQVASRLDPLRLRVGQALFVDFCNQNDPRARAANPSIPGCFSAVARAFAFQVRSWRYLPRVRKPGACRRDPSRGLTGQGPKKAVTRPRLLSSRLLVTRALPQPDWLGHPMSWNREESGRMSRFSSGARSGRVPVTSPPVGSACAELDATRDDHSRGRLQTGSSRLRGSSAEALRAFARTTQVEGRLPSPSAKRSAFRRTQDAFGRLSHPVRSVDFIPRLWPTCGLLPAPLQSTLGRHP